MKEITFHERFKQERVAFHDMKLFIVNAGKQRKEKGIFVEVVSLEDGREVKTFLAVPSEKLNIVRGKTSTSIRTRMQILGDYLALTTSHGEVREI